MDRAPTDISTLPLPDALPISAAPCPGRPRTSSEPAALPAAPAAHPPPPPARRRSGRARARAPSAGGGRARRSEEHTSELQSRQYLVCRLLLEKKNTTQSRSRQ